MILGDTIPAPTTVTLLYADLVGNGASGDLRFVNQSTVTDYVQVAVTTNYLSLPSSESFIMYNTPIPPQHTVGIPEISLGVKQGLFVYSMNGTTSFTYIGNTF